MRNSLLILVLILIASCQTGPSMRDQRMTDLALKNVRFYEVMENLKNDKVGFCKSDWLEVAKNLARLLEVEMLISHKRVFSGEYDSTIEIMENDVLNYIAPLAANAKLHYADKALENGCYSEAKLAYQSVMEVYLGTNYSAYRERAAIGLNKIP